MSLTKTLWTSIQNLVSTGKDVSDNLDTAFSNIDLAIDKVNQLDTLNTYDYIDTQTQAFSTTTFTEAARLTTISRDAGTYEFKFNMSYSYDNTTRSAYFRFSTDGGSTWTQVAREPKDTTDIYVKSLSLPVEHSGGVIDLIVQVMCENAADTLTLNFLSIVSERKG